MSSMPRFRQIGDSLVISKDEAYLVLIINRVNAFEAIANLGDPVLWVTIEWGGMVKASRTIKKALLNETFYFKLNVSRQ